MIKIENVSVMNMDNAIRGMRNPLNSWDKSDSFWCYDNGCYLGPCSDCDREHYILGPNDLQLASKLSRAGSDHRKFLRQIVVSVDLTAPLYFWKEYDTYKVGTVANSCSTMHTIHKQPFYFEDFSFEKVDDIALRLQFDIVNKLNVLRTYYEKTGDKKYWYSMIQLLPSSYNQKRTCTLNYEVLIAMYNGRKYHKLDEWREFAAWIEKLPYAKELICHE